MQIWQIKNGINFYGGRIGLKYQPSKNLEILVKGFYSEDTKADFTVDYRTPSSGQDRLIVENFELNHEDREVYQNESGHGFDRKEVGGTATLNWKMNDGVHTLSSITSYSDNAAALGRDFDATSSNAAFLWRKTDLETFTQEIRLSTPRENRKLFYTAGLFAMKDRLQSQDSLSLENGMSSVLVNRTDTPVGMLLPTMCPTLMRFMPSMPIYLALSNPRPMPLI